MQNKLKELLNKKIDDIYNSIELSVNNLYKNVPTEWFNNDKIVFNVMNDVNKSIQTIRFSDNTKDTFKQLMLSTKKISVNDIKNKYPKVPIIKTDELTWSKKDSTFIGKYGYKYKNTNKIIVFNEITSKFEIFYKSREEENDNYFIGMLYKSDNSKVYLLLKYNKPIPFTEADYLNRDKFLD